MNEKDSSGPKRVEKITSDLAALYDSVTDQYVTTFFDDLTDSPWLDSFLATVANKGRILDVGCGPGNFAKYISKAGYPVTGIDISPKMIEKAKELVPNCDFRVMNCLNLDFSEETFAGILIAYSLLHLPRSDAIDVLKQCFGVLQRKGTLCLMLKEGTGEHQCAASLAPGQTCFVQLWTKDDALSSLTSLGFSILKTEEGPPLADKELQFRKLLFIASKNV